MSYKYSYSSWWWTWRGPHHVEVVNKTDEIYWEYCVPSWFHLEAFIALWCRKHRVDLTCLRLQVSGRWFIQRLVLKVKPLWCWLHESNQRTCRKLQVRFCCAFCFHNERRLRLAFLLPHVVACDMVQMFDLGRCRLYMWKRSLVLCQHSFMHGSE